MNNKSLFYRLVITELKLKYKNSILGFFWVFLEPSALALILLIVFTQLFKNNAQNFPAYLLTGFVAWFFFSNTTSMLSVIVRKANIIKKTKSPKQAIVISTALTGLFDAIFGFLVLVIILSFLDIVPTINIIDLPLVIFLQFLFTLGIFFAISSIFVYVRDLDKAWNILLQIWFFITPIVYPQTLLSKMSVLFLALNPLLYFITAYRKILIYSISLTTNEILTLTFISLTSLIIGWKIFKKLEPNMVENL